jgi:dipeptidyl aminopeptidase/acylaminoacyl peptidase
MDPDTGAVGRTVLVPPSVDDVPAGQPFESITLSGGGNNDDVQAWVATPAVATAGAGPWPTIVHTHGGPTAVQLATFQPEAQAWLDLGFAWMSINYHGSTGFGKEWEASIYGQLGVLEVDDMAAGVENLLRRGIAKKGEIFLTGRSYGGYLTLQAAGRRPDLWAGGMGVVAIADWTLMYEDQADTLRGYQRALFKGSPDETPEATRVASPISYVKDVSAPLLVQQGANDTRCPRRQMEAYEVEMAKHDKPFTLDWVDAGHSSDDKEVTEQQQQMRMEFALARLQEIRGRGWAEEEIAVEEGVAAAAACKARL